MAKIRKQTTSGEMYPLIEQWQKSGQLRTDFCAAHNIRLATFTYWLTKYRDEKKTADAGFTRVEITTSAESSPAGLELRCPNGIQLNFTKLPAVTYLADLIKGL